MSYIINPYFVISAAPALWTPSQLGSAVKLWFEASDAANFSLSSTNVDQWNDLSGGAHHATATTTLRPTRVTVSDFGGLNAVLFDGTNDRLTTPNDGLNIAQPMSISAIYRTGSAINDLEVLIDTFAGGGNSTATFKWSGVSNKPHMFCDNAVARTNTVLSTSTPYMEVTNVTGSSSSCRINGNTASPSTFNPGTNSFGCSYIGGTTRGGYSTFSGHIAEIVVCNQVLSSTDYEKMEGYFAYKWSRQADLPGGHPYKSSPPTV